MLFLFISLIFYIGIVPGLIALIVLTWRSQRFKDPVSIGGIVMGTLATGVLLFTLNALRHFQGI